MIYLVRESNWNVGISLISRILFNQLLIKYAMYGFPKAQMQVFKLW